MFSLLPCWRCNLVAFFIFLRLAVADDDAPCYLPDGSRANGFFPCDPTAYITSCCPTGWTCYSNSMCVVTDPSTANSSHPIGTSKRGTCTNPVWNNAVCGDYCLNDSDVDGSLTPCGDNKFCCANDPSCSCSSGAFNINPGRVQTIIGVEGLEHTETSTIPVSTSGATLPTGSSATTLSTAVSFTAATGSTTPSPTVVPGEKATNKPGVKAGIALGVIFGVALLGLLGWFIYERFFSGTQWRTPRQVEVKPTSAPPGPAPTQDPYIPGNGTNLTLNPPMASTSWRSPENFDSGDAPYGNAYERDAPSRGPLVNSTTTVGTGTLSGSGGGGYNGARATSPRRPLSFLSDEEEIQYVRPRANELGI